MSVFGVPFGSGVRYLEVTKNVPVDALDEDAVVNILSEATLIPPEIIRSDYSHIVRHVLKCAELTKNDAYRPVESENSIFALFVELFFTIERFTDALPVPEDE